jgi:hypothetical protein
MQLVGYLYKLMEIVIEGGENITRVSEAKNTYICQPKKPRPQRNGLENSLMFF